MTVSVGDSIKCLRENSSETTAKGTVKRVYGQKCMEGRREVWAKVTIDVLFDGDEEIQKKIPIEWVQFMKFNKGCLNYRSGCLKTDIKKLDAWLCCPDYTEYERLSGKTRAQKANIFARKRWEYQQKVQELKKARAAKHYVPLTDGKLKYSCNGVWVKQAWGIDTIGEEGKIIKRRVERIDKLNELYKKIRDLINEIHAYDYNKVSLAQILCQILRDGMKTLNFRHQIIIDEQQAIVDANQIDVTSHVQAPSQAIIIATRNAAIATRDKVIKEAIEEWLPVTYVLEEDGKRYKVTKVSYVFEKNGYEWRVPCVTMKEEC